jgi:glutamate formiminotransferase
VGGPSLHPTAGASAVGARRFLIAFNLYLDRPDVAIARAIAKDIRQSGGGLAGVKAMGVSAQGQAQVSMNITDFTRTPVGEVYAAVKEKALRHGAAPARAELIGLIPEAALERNSEWLRLLVEFNPDKFDPGGFDLERKVLERRLEQPLAWPNP